MKQNKSWLQNWTTVGNLSSGGQGITYVVTKNDAADDEVYVLKVLKSQSDMDRRSRMYREVAALQSLDYPNITKCIDSNAHNFRDTNEALFLVTNYVKGQTLSDLVGNKPQPIDTTLQIFLKLLHCISYCHNNGIFHRDIKPDNIIIEADTSEPILIDFGLSFNEEINEGLTPTQTMQQLGNRFLALPELLERSIATPDHRSDLTQACGILFYMLTGKYPVTLLNENEEKPHERQEATRIFSAFPGDTKTLLISFFDRAFSIAIDRRFQTAESLNLYLDKINSAYQHASQGFVEENDKNAIRNLLSSKAGYKQYLDNLSMEKVMNYGECVLNSAQSNIFYELGHEEWDASMKYAKLRDTYKRKCSFSFQNKFWKHLKFSFTFYYKIDGRELIISLEENDSEIILLREPIASCDPNDQTIIGHINAVKNYILSKISQAIEKAN